MKRYGLLIAVIFLVGTVLPGGALAGNERKIEKEFETEAGKTVEFDLDAGGDIAIEPWDRDLIRVEVVLRGEDIDNIDIDFYMGRSGLEISNEFKKKLRRNRSDVDFIVRVPARYDVDFHTSGGDVEIEGIEGFIRGKTMGGDLDFSGLDGELSVTTMGGDISVRDSRLDGRVKTMGGSVDIDNVEGNLKGYTMGGDVEYRNARGSEDDDKEVNITTLGGDLDLDYQGKDIKARTMGGDIELGRGEKVKLSTMGGDIEVIDARDGADLHTMGGDITIGRADVYAKAKTMGGNIEINEVDGWVKATTMGGDVYVKMVGDPNDGKRDVELKSMGGDIELIVPDGLSMEFDVEIAYTKNCKKDCRIESDFDMQVKESKEWKSKWFQKRKYITGTGVTGDGRNKVVIRTTNGNVFIKKGD